MSSRDEIILSSAQDLFLRYGIGRTTMADIAQAAGVARQTLYNAYPNKDEVLRAVIRTSTQQSLSLVESTWATLPDLPAKIDFYFEQGPIVWYDVTASSPEAAEVIDGMNTIAKDEVAQAMAAWTEMFAVLFKDAGAANPSVMADFFVSSSKTAKYDVADRDALLNRLATLKGATLALLNK